MINAVFVARLRLKVILGIKVSYFDLRPSLTPDGKKKADMAVLTHFILKCDRDAEIASRIDYWRIRLRYYLELNSINKNIGTLDADKYMLQWGYLLEHDTLFDELIHGTHPSDAWEALKSLK